MLFNFSSLCDHHYCLHRVCHHWYWCHCGVDVNKAQSAQSAQKCSNVPRVPRVPKRAQKCPECPKMLRVPIVPKGAQSAQKCSKVPKVPRVPKSNQSAQSAQKCPQCPKVLKSAQGAQKCPDSPKVLKKWTPYRLSKCSQIIFVHWRSTQINLRPVKVFKDALWRTDGMTGMVIMGHRYSKSTFGANKSKQCLILSL